MGRGYPREVTLGHVHHDQHSGWWLADFVDSAGKRHREKVSRDEAEAREMLALLEGQAIRERYLDLRPLKRVRFGEYAEIFLDRAKNDVGSWKRYAASLGSLKPLFGNSNLTSIDAESIERFKQARVKDVAQATVNRDLQCLRRMFNLAIAWGYARENPVRLVKFFREKNACLRYLTREEFARLISLCPEPLRPVVTVAVNTGLRLGELLALLWRDVDLENGFVSVNDPKNATPRKVPINSTAHASLLGLRQFTKGLKVFTDSAGDPFKSRTVEWQFRRSLDQAGIQDFRFHDLRHTCASWLAMAGVPILTIKEILGHKDIRMTVRYAHLAPDQRVDAVKRLDAFVQARQGRGTESTAVQ